MTPEEKARAIAKALIERAQTLPDYGAGVTWRDGFVSLHTHDRFTERSVDLFTGQDDPAVPVRIRLLSSITVMGGPYLDDLEAVEVETVEAAVAAALAMFDRLRDAENTANAALALVEYQQRTIDRLRGAAPRSFAVRRSAPPA